MLERILQNIEQQINAVGTLSFVLDLVLCIACIVFIFIVFSRFIPKKYLVFGAIFYIVGFMASFLFGFTFFKDVLVVGFLSFMVLGIVFYVPEVKKAKITRNAKSSRNYVSTEDAKEELIDTLIKTISHLSERHIGAIITLEKEKSLNAFIEKAVKLDALVSFELLDTIFFKNTALHDGAVIIRGNRIVCASAFYPSSEKADIPQHYGSRHRAAIGISEQTDAYTIVVSEETGEIATTINGTIAGDVSLEALRSSLSQQVVVHQ